MTDFLSEWASEGHLDSFVTRTKRDTCSTCRRPCSTCWCSFLPTPCVDVGNHKVLILQHPGEGKKRLQTAPMLVHGTKAGTCEIVVGRRFTNAFVAGYMEKLKGHEFVLLYPCEDAKSIENIDPSSSTVVVMLDGTWSQARSIYSRSPALWNIPKVKIQSSSISEYVIRTQPADACLSTVEAGAAILSALAKNTVVYDALVQPLRALVRCQLSHGAVIHDTNEKKILELPINSPLPKRTRQKLKKCGLNVNNRRNEALQQL
ncbi:unnamed protein product [Notodromas monacha]|uniref:tRNA-uridine aminocarboxypropyltransferase n=1 Tax=Notodromas monacha TaxID=399045 RepID=A0A7R9BIP9_9CRUS|nr:unnamed protein product [Notodromas monacha]CAG0914824.1 unnamed protein product [Notodromas monacha]